MQYGCQSMVKKIDTILLKRPENTYESLSELDPNRPDLSPAITEAVEIEIKYAAVDAEIRRLEKTSCPGGHLADLLRRPENTYESIADLDPNRPELPPAVTEAAEIEIKYAGYLRRQEKQVEEMKRLESRTLPAGLDYLSMQGLRLEARQKLDKIRPENLGQASRISGVSPADIAALMVYLEPQR